MESDTRLDQELKNFRLIKMVEEVEDYAIFTLDYFGNIENWNKGAEKLKGYSAGDIIGNHFSIFYTPEDFQKQLPTTLINIAIRDGRARNQGWRVRKDGTKFWAYVVITSLYDNEGRVIGFTKVTQDITAKMLVEKAVKKHAAELELKNKELEQFVYIASHDLQEPLLTVHSFVELLEEEYSEEFSGNAALYFTYIKDSTIRMRHLIKGLLEYSRIGRKSVLSNVDCNTLLKTVLNSLEASIKVSGAQINHNRLPVIMGYEVELGQLFQNLISNAIKFRKTDVPPQINITAQSYSEGWRFAVSDNGIGIDPQQQDKVFLIFQRLNTRDKYEGSGIGLANCKKIVHLHNGEIGLESVPGEGSTFYFNIAV